MNLARLNHILIPDTKADRDRLRRTRLGRYVMRPVFRCYLALSQEGRAALLLCLLAGVAGLDISRLQNYWLASLLFGALTASLCVRPWFRLNGVSVHVETPKRVMVGEELELRLHFRSRSERSVHHLRCERPILPWDGSWIDGAPCVETLEMNGETWRTTHARFVARGPHHLDSIFVAALLPGRLAQGPTLQTNGVRFTVVPRMARVAELGLPGAQRSQPGGSALVSNAGDSLEVCGVRPYVPGDPIRDLHAVTWARLGSPAVRVYQQESFTRLSLIVDTNTHANPESHFEAGLSLAAGVSAHLARGEVRVAVTLTGEQHDPLLLGAAQSDVDRVLDLCAIAQPGTPFSAEATLIRIKPELERLSCAFLIALDWDDERQKLVALLRSSGIPVRVWIVSSSEDPVDGAPLGREERRVSVESILRDELLHL